MKAMVLLRALACALVITLAAGAARAAESVQRYDAEYPQIGYSDKPTHNAFYRLQQRLDKGEVKLEWRAPRGYLDSLLKALDIDPSSQSLVFSKTSLQINWINEKTPRAIYFDDENYVAWVDGAPTLELMGVDSVMGPVFYTLDNRNPSATAKLERETTRCLNCHDSFSLSGGGVPHFLMISTNAGVEGDRAQRSAAIDTTDATPMKDRWGGWYVTGHGGNQPHLGNIIIKSPQDLDRIESLRKPDIDTLKDVFDTQPYITDKSDVVALVVLAHQVTVHNLITRANFKTRRFVAREIDPAQNPNPTWADFSPKTQKVVRTILEPLVRGLLHANAAPFTAPMVGNAGYDAWFQKQGPKDPRGRSLRELDLKTRVFKYPLSYLIYSDGFKGLPEYAKQYVYQRLAEILRGQDQSPAYASLSATDRQSILEILTSTDPAFARVASMTTTQQPSPGGSAAKAQASAAATAGGSTAAPASPSCAAPESARPAGCLSSRG
jgi:hypothetical protein